MSPTPLDLKYAQDAKHLREVNGQQLRQIKSLEVQLARSICARKQAEKSVNQATKTLGVFVIVLTAFATLAILATLFVFFLRLVL
jgi:hypothetical protein